MKPIDASRVALGLVFLARTTPLSRWLPSPFSHVLPPLLGWPEHGFRAAWGGLALPDAILVALCIARTVAAVLFTVGAWTRAAGVVAALSALAVASQDAFAYKFTLYTLFVGTGLVALSGAGQSLALRPSAPEIPPAGPQLVRWFVASVYAWSGIAKLRPAWLSGDTLRVFHDGHYLTGALADHLFADPARCHASAWAVVIVELLLGPLLLAPRTRRAGLVLAVAMHVVYEVTAQPDVFGWIMGALLLSFLGGGSAFTRRRPPADAGTRPG